MTLKASAKRLVPGKEPGALYSTEPPAARDAALVALPYHLWANRTPGSMQVWVAELVRAKCRTVRRFRPGSEAREPSRGLRRDV